MPKNTILVCGAGSLGTYLGIKLLQAGHHVTIYGRHKLGETGEEVILNGETTQLPDKIQTLPTQKLYDVIFITSKLYDVENIMQQIKQAQVDADKYVSIQNGVFDSNRFPLLFEKKPTIVTSRGGYSLYDKEMKAMEHSFGRPTDDTHVGKGIARVLKDAGIPAHTNDTQKLRLIKMLFNCIVNGLGAVHAKTIKELFTNQEYEGTIHGLLDEGYDILKKEFNSDIGSKESLKKALYKDYPSMNHYVSTYRDVIQGKENEISYLNGYIVKLAKKHGLPCDHHEKLIQDLGPVVEMYKKARAKKQSDQ